jgi:hypothetical protein
LWFELGVTHLIAGLRAAVRVRPGSATLAANPARSRGSCCFSTSTRRGARWLMARPPRLAPHTVVRGCAVTSAVGVLWTWFGFATAEPITFGHAAIPALVDGAGITMARSSRSIRRRWRWQCGVAALGALCSASSPLVTVGVAIISLVLVAYSVAGAQTDHRRRPQAAQRLDAARR